MKSADSLRKLVHSMQQLSSTEMEELFRILEKAKCSYTCNNHGVFVNLSWLSPEVICEIEKFISYCDKCRIELDRYDTRQSECTSMMAPVVIEKEKSKDRSGQAETERVWIEEDTKNRKARTTSYNMKFYLLKKRLQRTVNLYSDWDDQLDAEEYEYDTH